MLTTKISTFSIMIINCVSISPQLLGLALLGTTVWIFMDETMLSPVATDMEGYNHVLYFLMVIAGIMTIMGFLGCCGALNESQCMLATFFTLVCILFIGQVRFSSNLFICYKLM